MSHHHHSHKEEEAEKSLDNIYYLVGLLSGLFTGAILDRGLIWIPIGGITGLFFTAAFLKLLVKDREW